jgi:hypothetical protein
MTVDLNRGADDLFTQVVELLVRVLHAAGEARGGPLVWREICVN